MVTIEPAATVAQQTNERILDGIAMHNVKKNRSY